ncbi:MAG: hypothetical protein NC400_10700 [Clostridium sp.]|nr:hypothetical protein [Clostridium sp.]
MSNTLPTLQNDFKVKIDDIRKRIDVEVIRRNGVTEAADRVICCTWRCTYKVGYCII